MTFSSSKTVFRRQVRAYGSKWAPDEKIRCDRKIQQQLIDFINDQVVLLKSPHKKTIGFYWPLPHEVDCHEALTHFSEKGDVIALPVVVQKNAPLVFRVYQPGDALESSYGHSFVPSPQAETLVPDILVIPCLGAHPDLYRLGHGGGFYDRTLAALRPIYPDLLTIGLCYEAFIFPDLPLEPHDQPLNCIITEKSVKQRS